MTERSDIRSVLISLELELLSGAARSDAQRLLELIADDFEEVGQSGTHYSRHEILTALAAEDAPPSVTSDSFVHRVIGEGVHLLTYRTSPVNHDGTAALRSSIWRETKDGFQITYHQGTPASLDD